MKENFLMNMKRMKVERQASSVGVLIFFSEVFLMLQYLPTFGEYLKFIVGTVGSTDSRLPVLLVVFAIIVIWLGLILNTVVYETGSRSMLFFPLAIRAVANVALAEDYGNIITQSGAENFLIIAYGFASLVFIAVLKHNIIGIISDFWDDHVVKVRSAGVRAWDEIINADMRKEELEKRRRKAPKKRSLKSVFKSKLRKYISEMLVMGEDGLKYHGTLVTTGDELGASKKETRQQMLVSHSKKILEKSSSDITSINDNLRNMHHIVQHMKTTNANLLQQVRSQLAQKKLRDAKQRIAKLRLLRGISSNHPGVALVPPKNKLPPAPLLRRRILVADSVKHEEPSSDAAREALRIARRELRNAPPAPPRDSIE